MDNNEDKNYQKNRPNSQNSGWNGKFLERKKQALREQHEKRKKQQQTQQLEFKKKSNKMNQSVQNSNRSYSNSFLNRIPIFGITPQIHKQQATFSIQKKSDQNSQTKKVVPQQILLKGKIIKIIQKTLNDQFRVQCQYQEQVVELIASKQDIVKNNIIPLLDFYQKILNLK